MQCRNGTGTVEPDDTFAEVFEVLNDSTPVNFTDYAAVLECAINIAVNVSEEFEIYSVWEKYEPTIDTHLANIKECPSIGDPELVQQYV